MPLRFYKDVWDHFSVSTWNSGGDHGVYINMHLQQYFRSGMIMPPLEKSVLERDIQPVLGTHSN